MEISKALLEDLDFVYAIESSCIANPWSKSSLMDALENENARYLVVKDKDEVLGFLGMWYGLDEAEITNVCVNEKHRRRGVCKMLLNGALELAKQDNIVKLFLEVRESNEVAKAAYLNFGFKSIGVRKNFYEKPVEDAVVMLFRV